MMYIPAMGIHRPAKVVASEPDHRVGIYAPKFSADSNRKVATPVVDYPYSNPEQLQDLFGEVYVLDSLAEHELLQISCLIADIRYDARQVLSDCHDVAHILPVIALADHEQLFEEDYPYGTYVADVTTPAELGKSIFWLRVKRAVQAYDQPLTIEDVGSPVYHVFRAIADQTSDWILIKDLQHRFVVAGEHFAAAAGAPIHEIIGRDDLEIGSSAIDVKGDPETGIRGFWPQDKAVTDSGKSTVEENPEWLLYSRKARYRRTYRVPLKNPAGRVFALLVCSQDITEQVNNEHLLAERTSMLEQVTEEKKQAEINRRIAEDAVAAKTRFLAAASHDLRQPLHAMGLFLDSLEKRMKGREEQYLVQQIKQSRTSLSALFSSCLDISRLDAGIVETQPEHFSALSLLEVLSDEFRRQSREKSLDYRLSVDHCIIIDSDKVLLTRIVRNLLNNAVRYTDQGDIHIQCTSSDSLVYLSVSDTGRGIALDERELIFDEFHQVNPGDAGRGRGLGLGLSIVKRLCQLLDIAITVESEPGQGSKFTLSIPAGKPERITLLSEKQPVNMVENLSVVVVEDDLHIRYGMEVLLQSYGCLTLCEADIDSAIRVLETSDFKPDIVIADYHLGGNDTGTQAIQKLCLYLGRQVPGLLVTGDTSSESDLAATRFGLPVLHKPVDSDKLLAAINSEVRRAPT